MKRASITHTKNHLSQLIDWVREGQSVLIMDRKVPVARLVPVDTAELTTPEWVGSLVRHGLVSPPRKRLDVKEFILRPKARTSRGASAVQALIAEREEGR